MRFKGVCLVLPILAALPAGACQEEDSRVKVTVVVILASEEGDHVDRRLKHIAAEIRKLNPSLKSFKLRRMTDHSLAPGEKALLPLVEGKQVQIVVKHGSDKNNKVCLAVTAPDQGEIVYRSTCGKFLPIVTRCRTKDRQRLILAIRLLPCAGE